jgi:hypothetical protein
MAGWPLTALLEPGLAPLSAGTKPVPLTAASTVAMSAAG